MKTFFVLSSRVDGIYGLLLRTIFWVMIVLIFLGLLFVYSSSAIYSNQIYHDQLFLFRRQALAAIFGLIVWWFFSRLSGLTWSRFVAFLGPLCLFLLVLTIFPNPLRHRVGGASRWLRILGFQLQPSEFFKVMSIWGWALFFQDPKRSWSLVWLLGGWLVLALQPDFGSLVILVLMVLAGVWIRTGWFIWFLGAAGSMFLALLGLILFSSYRLARVKAFLNPFKDPLGKGFQILQSLIACARGGLLGDGIGNSVQKLFFLPEAHNDFVLAVIWEESGLIGTLCVWSLFGLLFFLFFILLFRLSYSSFWLVFFIFTLLFYEVFFHFAVVVGAAPTKGLTLPFISCGGSSLVAHCLLMSGLSSIIKEEALRSPLKEEGRL